MGAIWELFLEHSFFLWSCRSRCSCCPLLFLLLWLLLLLLLLLFLFVGHAILAVRVALPGLAVTALALAVLAALLALASCCCFLCFLAALAPRVAFAALREAIVEPLGSHSRFREAFQSRSKRSGAISKRRGERAQRASEAPGERTLKDEMGEPGGRQHKSGQQNAYKEVKATRPHNVTHVTERENKARWHTHLTARAHASPISALPVPR